MQYLIGATILSVKTVGTSLVMTCEKEGVQFLVTSFSDYKNEEQVITCVPLFPSSPEFQIKE